MSKKQNKSPPLKSTLFTTTKDKHGVFMGSFGPTEDTIKTLEGLTQ